MLSLWMHPWWNIVHCLPLQHAVRLLSSIRCLAFAHGFET